MWAPNSFTPNGDGLNEVFRIEGADMGRAELLIFNRWGELLHTADESNLSWDGRVNGNIAEQGVYVWKLNTAIRCQFDDHEYTGHVTLLR